MIICGRPAASAHPTDELRWPVLGAVAGRKSGEYCFYSAAVWAGSQQLVHGGAAGPAPPCLCATYRAWHMRSGTQAGLI